VKSFCLAALLLVATTAKPGAAILGEELAVLQAMATIITSDASRSYGSSGGVMRLDKVGGESKKTARCGGSIKAEG
jgi:hypothetical protein